jgi:hypothetical protein
MKRADFGISLVDYYKSPPENIPERALLVLVQAEKTALFSPPSVSIPWPVKLSSTFCGKAPQRATFGPAPARLKAEAPL